MRTRFHLPLLLGCFFLSGSAGLIYEVVWERYLRTLFGNTTGAVTAVLAAFMGGLALGGYLLGKAADRSRDRLALYAWLEFGCTLYALAFPWLFAQIAGVHTTLIRGIEEPGLAVEAMRLALSLALLLPPTVLMGGTLPVMARQLDASRHLPLLYAVNSLGAVAGCVAAGFWLLEWLGLTATLSLAAVLNALAAIGALALRSPDKGRSDSGPERLTSAAPPSPPPAAKPLEAPRPRFSPLRGMLTAAFLSGFACMLLEVGLTRLLALILGSSVHAFALMLAGFIAGIAIGSWSLPRESRSNPALGFACGQIAIGLIGLLAIPLAGSLADLVLSLRIWINWDFNAFHVTEFAVCLLAIFPATFFFGRTFPLSIRAVMEGQESAGSRIGAVYAANTVGTLLGSVSAGMFLIPWTGVRATMVLGCLACLASAGVSTAGRYAFTTWFRWALGVFVGAALLVTAGPAWDLSRLVRPIFRYRPGFGVPRPGEAAPRLIYYREDAITTVSVEDTGPHLRTLKVNSKPDASNGLGDMRTQSLTAHLPLVLTPRAKDVLIVGLGSGTTVAAALAHPVDRVDCIELSPAVVEASRLFEQINRRCWESPRVRICVNDARSYLSATERQYDCIISEPSNPWVAGVASLYTRECLESCRARLRPGGLMAQWIHTYETSEEVIRIVLRTFRSVFPHTVVSMITDVDIELLGSTEPIRPDFAASAARVALPAVAADLDKIGIRGLFPLIATSLFSERGAAEYAGAGVLHSDDYPLVDFLASRAFFAGHQARLPQRHYRFRDSETLTGAYLAGRSPTPQELLAFARSSIDFEMNDGVLSATQAAADGLPGDPEAQRTAGRVLFMLRQYGPALERARAAVKAGGGGPALELQYQAALAVARMHQPFLRPPDVSEPLQAKTRLLEMQPDQETRHRADLAAIHALAGDHRAAIAQLEIVLKRDPANARAREVLESLREAGGR